MKDGGAGLRRGEKRSSFGKKGAKRAICHIEHSYTETKDGQSYFPSEKFLISSREPQNQNVHHFDPYYY